MKKLTCTLLVAMVTMVVMTAMAFIPPPVDPPVIVPMSDYFTITNKTTNIGPKKILVDDFTLIDGNGYLYDMNLEGGVCAGDELEIVYHNVTFLGTPQVAWAYGWLGVGMSAWKSGLTANVPVGVSPTINGVLVVQFDYQGNGTSGTLKLYSICFRNVRTGNRVTAKNINASEVQVTYEDYEEVASAGQRASVALYDIYGNLVSMGYLDGFGMSTLSTKGKSGIYIVKVTMNNQVIFNQRIQVK